MRSNFAQFFGRCNEKGLVRKGFHGGWKLYRTISNIYFSLSQLFLLLYRKDRDEERSDGHRSSRHKRSKHSHRDSEKEDRSSSHGRDEMGKDLVIADSI